MFGVYFAESLTNVEIKRFTMDKCRDMNIHRMNGQFDYPLFGTVHIFLKRNDLEIKVEKYLTAIYLGCEKYYQVDCPVLIIDWFEIF